MYLLRNGEPGKFYEINKISGFFNKNKGNYLLKLYIDRNNEKEYSKYINNEHELAIDERKVHMEENMIITISRQYGSGGSQVAKILAESGWGYGVMTEIYLPLLQNGLGMKN